MHRQTLKTLFSFYKKIKSNTERGLSFTSLRQHYLDQVMGMISARFIKAPPMIITGKGNRFFYIYNTVPNTAKYKCKSIYQVAIKAFIIKL